MTTASEAPVRNPRAGGANAPTLMTFRVANEPKKAAAELRAHVDGGLTATEIAAKYGVTLKTLLRWRAKLVELIGERAVGFSFPMERRSAATRAKWEGARRNAAKKAAPKKKRGRPKKGIAN